LCIAPRICPCCRTSGGSFVFRIRSVTMSPNAFVAFRSVANHTTREKHCTKISVSLVQCFNCVVLSNKVLCPRVIAIKMHNSHRKQDGIH
ncbi:hypothetical protein KCV04_g7, partial [Aureobasidium melanogenum]